MVTVEYGKENNDVVILLHGGGFSWWNHQETAELLQKDYHVILPIISGHGENNDRFTDIETFADELIREIDSRFTGKVKLIGGVSLVGFKQVLDEENMVPGIGQGDFIQQMGEYKYAEWDESVSLSGVFYDGYDGCGYRSTGPYFGV